MRPVVFVALLAAVSPQDPPPDRESLVKELEDKFLAMGPVTVDVTYESIDSQGVAKAMSTVRAHFRLRDHWAHVVTRNLAEHPPSPETHILFEGPYTMISWSGDGEARWLEEFDYVRSFFQSHYENLTSLAPIFGKPPKHPDRASYWRDLKPKLNLLLTPSGDKNMPAFAKADLALASSSRRASWLEDLESAPAADVSVGKVAVTVASPVTGRSIVIDRGTGFLRSIRMDLKTAGTWGLKVENVERSPLRPPVRIPEKVEYKRAPLDNVPSRLSASLAANLPDLLGRLLGEWGRVGAPERAEELADFLATVAIRHEAMRREVLHRRLAAGMVKTVRDRGGSVSDVEKDLTEAVNALQSSIRENEERLKPDLEKITADFKTEMIKAAEGSGAAAEGLTRAIQKAFEPDRLKRVRTTVRPPEAGPILGQEIAATYARERAPILHTFRSRRELAWELGRRLADLESISFRLVLENVDAANMKTSSAEIDAHFRPAEGFGYAEWFNRDADRRTHAQTLLIEKGEKTTFWRAGAGGQVLNQLASWKSSVRSLREWESAVACLHGRAPPEKLEIFEKSSRPYLRIDAQSTEESGVKTSMTLLLTSRPEGGATWLDELKTAKWVEFPEGPQGACLRYASGRRTVEVDLKTGFLRSIRTDFDGGAHGGVKIENVKIGAAKPAVSRPGEINERVVPGEQHASGMLSFLEDELAKESLVVLMRWERFDSAEGAEALRAFYSAAAAIQSDCWREKGRLSMALEFVRKAQQQGKTPDDLEKQVSKMAAFLAEKGESSLETRVSREMGEAKTRLINAIRSINAPLAAHRGLESHIESVFRSDRKSGDRPAQSAEEWAPLLKAAIEEVRVQGLK